MVGRPPAKRGRPAKSTGRGRPSKSGRRSRSRKEEEDESSSSDAETEAVTSPIYKEEEQDSKTVAVTSDEEKPDEDEVSTSSGKKLDTPRRGRKRKAELISLERREPEMDIKERDLRRRDTIRSTSRYSPPPVLTTRGRGGRVATSARSTPTTHASVSVEDSSDVIDDIGIVNNIATSTTPTNVRTYSKRGRGRPSAASIVKAKNTEESVTTPIEVVKSVDNKTFHVKLPDGGSVSLAVPPTIKRESIDAEEDGLSGAEKRRSERDQKKDPEYVPLQRVLVRRKSATQDATQLDESSSPSTSAAKPAAAVVARSPAGARSPTKSLMPTVRLTNQTTSISLPKLNNTNSSTTTSATVPSKQLPTILKGSTSSIITPKISSLPSTSSSKTNLLPTVKAMEPVSLAGKRVPLHKYLDSLPDIKDCVFPDSIADEGMVKLPDRVLLVHSELPLKLSVNIENDDKLYLFRQVISPLSSARYVCLLCKGIDVNFATKDEKDILLHYQSLHELEVEIAHAKFSEEIVFICLPKIILSQFTIDESIQLNSNCQYCPARLVDVHEMREHYAVQHQKKVVMMEQEEILKMHHFYYCCKCKFQSADFDSHMTHMKTEHQLKSYRCKSCVLVTQDENRLRTHFKAKHMLHTQGQNLQCYYCHGLLIGVERLQKHIQQSHMVQTGPQEWSCIACQLVAGLGKQLLEHAQLCKLAGKLPLKSEHQFVAYPVKDEDSLAPGEIICLFCNAVFYDEETLNLHLHHEHMRWVDPKTLSSNSEQVKSEESNIIEMKTDEAATSDTSKDPPMLQVCDVISNEQMENAKIKTYVGHWCRICDTMVKVYQLYYLHMNNYHKQVKRFVCIISDCKKMFENYTELKAHIQETGHSQKTIITNPDEVFVCAYCDLYFPSENDLIAHLITDQHINKFTSSGHFHRTEPRNFKCKACHTFFGMKESYIHHLETEAHLYTCKYCGITTATACARHAHTTNTHPDKLNECEECDELVADTMTHYVQHGYTFECKKCVKKFYNRERLNAHMEVHQDPIECNWVDPRTNVPCQRNIATRSMMVTHYRSHKSDHKCNTCGQAFWNYSMLSSHYRSHQAQRVVGGSSAMGGSSSNRIVSRVPIANRNSITTTAGRRPPILSNSVVKCGTCKDIFKSHKELASHKCTLPTSTVVGTSSAPSTSRGVASGSSVSKVFDLSKATTSQAKSVNPRSRRRYTPKKSALGAAQLLSEQETAAQNLIEVSGIGGDHQLLSAGGLDDDTQLIMILNQATGELMEITAPKGMEVADVIQSLNLTPADYTTQTRGEDGVITAIIDQPGTEIQADDVVAQEEIVSMEETHEEVVTEEVIHHKKEPEDEQVTVVAGPSRLVIKSEMEDSQIITETEETIKNNGEDNKTHEELIETQEDGNLVEEHVVTGEEGQQFIIEDHGGERQIILPAECFNEDGTLTLDEETMARLSLRISPEGEILAAHDPGTYVTEQ